MLLNAGHQGTGHGSRLLTSMLAVADERGLPMKIEIDGNELQLVGTVGDEPEPFLDAAGEPYEVPTGAPLTASAFETGLPGIGHILVAFSLAFFAYSTMIAWSYYGDRCFEYLLGARAVTPFRYVFCVFVLLGAIGGLDLVWTVADNLNAMMAIPNLVALLGLSGVVVRESNDYLDRVGRTTDGDRETENRVRP